MVSPRTALGFLLKTSMKCFLMFLGFLIVIMVLPYCLIWLPGAFLPSLAAVGTNLIIRCLLVVKYKQPFLAGVLLHPVSICLTVVIGLASFAAYIRGTYRWKGRCVAFEK